jgi:type IV pilus assembly protein PilA
MKKQKGFSLIELLIVVAIILIIAAIAIPNLMRSKMAANESSAVGSLRTINTAMVTYSTNFPTLGYAGNLGALGNAGAPTPCTSAQAAVATAACLIDSVLASGTKSGYNFFVGGLTGNPAVTYTSSATPVAPNQSGSRYFCSDQSGVIYYNLATACTSANGTPL